MLLEDAMLKEIWEPGMKVLFVSPAIDEVSDKLGFYHLLPRDRFWEAIELGGITQHRIITASERKALEEGQKQGSLSDPIRQLFIEKRTSQLLKLGIGLTNLNWRVISSGEKDKIAWPTEEDLAEFVLRVAERKPRILAFVVNPELFVGLFKCRFPGVTSTMGLQSFEIEGAEVWLLGSTVAKPRGEALAQQEDAFFELGERISASTE
jgi:G:T/U-mismatch repair DNA glycosylase